MSIINDSDIISSFKGHVSLTEIERTAINHFFSEHRADSLTLFHVSSRSNRTSILKKGLCLTSTKYCHGYSSFGFLYCSLYPDRAFEYGRMNSQSDVTDIYAFFSFLNEGKDLVIAGCSVIADWKEKEPEKAAAFEKYLESRNCSDADGFRNIISDLMGFSSPVKEKKHIRPEPDDSRSM